LPHVLFLCTFLLIFSSFRAHLTSSSFLFFLKFDLVFFSSGRALLFFFFALGKILFGSTNVFLFIVAAEPLHDPPPLLEDFPLRRVRPPLPLRQYGRHLPLPGSKPTLSEERVIPLCNRDCGFRHVYVTFFFCTFCYCLLRSLRLLNRLLLPPRLV